MKYVGLVEFVAEQRFQARPYGSEGGRRSVMLCRCTQVHMPAIMKFCGTWNCMEPWPYLSAWPFPFVIELVIVIALVVGPKRVSGLCFCFPCDGPCSHQVAYTGVQHTRPGGYVSASPARDYRVGARR